MSDRNRFLSDNSKLPWPLYKGFPWAARRFPELPVIQSDSGGTVGSSPTSTDSSQQDQAALTQLVQVWNNRLQVLSVVTTFFTSMDGTLLGLMAGSLDGQTAASQIAVGGLAGALVLHIAATIIGFVASFALIQYQAVDAKQGLPSPDGGDSGEASDASTSAEAFKVAAAAALPSAKLPRLANVATLSYSAPMAPFTTQSSVLIEHVRSALFPRFIVDPAPPLKLLTRCNLLCIWLTGVGFVLAVTGVLSYLWTALTRAVSIFASACLFISFVIGIFALR